MKHSILLATLILLCAIPAHAQIFLSEDVSGLIITVSPQHPSAGSTASLRLSSSLFELSELNIRWSVDGRVIREDTGATEASVTVGPAGSETEVTVTVTVDEDTEAVETISIVPASVDLLWEVNSYTPPFYPGRAYPTAGSRIRYFAVPHIASAGGGAIAASELVYTWRRNGDVLQSVSGRGRRSIELDAPLLFGRDTISVEVSSTDKSVGATGVASVSTQDPLLRLYQDHPLYGVMYHSAFDRASGTEDTVETFTAVPYFAPVRTPIDERLQYAWRVNQTNVVNDPERPDSITVDSGPDGAAGTIRLTLTHASNYFLEAENFWNITFGQSGGVRNVFDPFRSPL